MQNWSGLLRRKNVLSRTENERGQVQDGLVSVLDSISADFESEKDALHNWQNFSRLVNNMVWVRQIQGRVSQIQQSSKVLLGDLGSFESFESKLDNLNLKIRGYEENQFQEWLSEVESKSINEEISLDLSKPLMEFI